MAWCKHQQQLADEITAAGLAHVRANREHWIARAKEVLVDLEAGLLRDHRAGRLPFPLDEADPVGSWLDDAIRGETDESWRRQTEEHRQLLGDCKQC